jgi:recombination protein RecT
MATKERIGAPNAKKDPLQYFVEQVTRKGEQFAALGVDPKRFIRIVVTYIRSSKDLSAVTALNPASVLGEVVRIAQWNLDPSVINEVHLIPYDLRKQNATPYVQAQLGYKGLQKLVQRAGRELGNAYTALHAKAVYSGDIYESEDGAEPFLRHRRAFRDRGQLSHFYAVARDSAGRTVFVEMSVDEVKKHKSRFSKAKAGPLADPENFEAYGCKTVFRLLACRHLDQTPILSDAIIQDLKSEGGTGDLAEAFYTEPERSEAPDDDQPEAAQDEAAGDSEPPEEGRKARTKPATQRVPRQPALEAPREGVGVTSWQDMVKQATAR